MWWFVAIFPQVGHELLHNICVSLEERLKYISMTRILQCVVLYKGQHLLCPEQNAGSDLSNLSKEAIQIYRHLDRSWIHVLPNSPSGSHLCTRKRKCIDDVYSLLIIINAFKFSPCVLWSRYVVVLNTNSRHYIHFITIIIVDWRFGSWSVLNRFDGCCERALALSSVDKHIGFVALYRIIFYCTAVRFVRQHFRTKAFAQWFHRWIHLVVLLG